MPYQVTINPLGDFNKSVSAAIWDPPPGAGSSPGNPTDTATVTDVPPDSISLTFAHLNAAPESGTLWVSNATGDLFRSGPANFFPDSPAPLTLFVLPGQPPKNKPDQKVALVQADLDGMTSGFVGMTIRVPVPVQVACALLSGGYFTPMSITISSASLSLPPEDGEKTLRLSISGTIRLLHWIFAFTKSFSFAMTLTLSPSNDPVDTARVLKATGTAPSLGAPGTGLPRNILNTLQMWAAPALASLIEGVVNSRIAAQVPDSVPSGEALSPTAVISMANIDVIHDGILVFVAIADLFGPGLIPAPVMTTVPDVVGDDIPTAEHALAAAHLIFEEQKGNSSPRLDQPTVVKADPSAGQRVPEGTLVTCIVDYPENQV